MNFLIAYAAVAATLIPWPPGLKPSVPAGYDISVFAKLESPGMIYVLDDGDILVAQAKKSSEDSSEKSPNQITRFHLDADGKILNNAIFIDHVELPFGMAVWKEEFFVATPTQVLRYRYDNDLIWGPGTVIATLPAPKEPDQWMRNLLLSADGNKLFVSLGSEILQMNRDGTGTKVFARDLSNAVSMAFEPKSGVLWTTEAERDSTGLVFTEGAKFPMPFNRGALISQQGSWNESKLIGFKLIYVPFENGKMLVPELDFMTGFIADAVAGHIYGRPLCLAIMNDGSLLVSDDAGNRIWKVSRLQMNPIPQAK